jgi:hypothetical protein
MDSPEIIALKAELAKMSKNELIDAVVAYINKAIDLGVENMKLKKLLTKNTY